MKSTTINTIFWSVIITFPFISCEKNNATLHTLTTDPVKSVYEFGAISGGTIISSGDGIILQKGICLSSEPHPTINDVITDDGSSYESFRTELDGLREDTEYYIRSYASTESGVVYGDEIQFRTLPCNQPTTVNCSEEPCDVQYIENHTGTAGCFDGPCTGSPGETLTFQFYCNIPNVKILWMACSSIRIVSGQNTDVVTLHLHDAFTGGYLSVKAEGGGKGVQMGHWISSK